MIAFNTIVDSAGPYLDLSAGHGGSGRTLRPESVTLANNLLVLGEGGQLLTGEAGAEWKWLGNIASFSRASALKHVGIRIADAHLVRGSDGLHRPGANSPALGAAARSFSAVTNDIDGQPRKRAARCRV